MLVSLTFGPSFDEVSFQVRRVSFALPVKLDSAEESQEKSAASQLKTSSSSPFTAVKQVLYSKN